MSEAAERCIEVSMSKGVRNRKAGKELRAKKIAPHAGANTVGNVGRSGNRASRRAKAAMEAGKGQRFSTPPRGPGKHAGEAARARMKQQSELPLQTTSDGEKRIKTRIEGGGHVHTDECDHDH